MPLIRLNILPSFLLCGRIHSGKRKPSAYVCLTVCLYLCPISALHTAPPSPPPHQGTNAAGVRFVPSLRGPTH